MWITGYKGKYLVHYEILNIGLLIVLGTIRRNCCIRYVQKTKGDFMHLRHNFPILFYLLKKNNQQNIRKFCVTFKIKIKHIIFVGCIFRRILPNSLEIIKLQRSVTWAKYNRIYKSIKLISVPTFDQITFFKKILLSNIQRIAFTCDKSIWLILAIYFQNRLNLITFWNNYISTKM